MEYTYDSSVCVNTRESSCSPNFNTLETTQL